MNTHKGFTFFNRKFILHELRDAVRAVSADVVFLQEVLGTHAEHSARLPNWPDAPQYEFLADSMWPEFAYGRNAVYPSGDHGNAILSKFPIVRYENRDVTVSGPERRGLLHCVLSVPCPDDLPEDSEVAAAAPQDAGDEMECTQQVHVFCVHLGLRESHRRRQLELLCEMVRTEVPDNAPLVVAGDFNDWRLHADPILAHGAGLREVFVRAHGQAARTFPARCPVLRLDRIYVRNARGHAPFVLPRQPWSHLSDHAPLAAEISV